MEAGPASTPTGLGTRPHARAEPTHGGNAQGGAWLCGQVALPSLEHQPARGTGQHRATFMEASRAGEELCPGATLLSNSQSVNQNQKIDFVKGGRGTENRRDCLGEAQS